MNFNLLKFSFCLLCVAILTSCYQEKHQIVPCELDTDKLYAPLRSNDGNPDEMTFGKQNLPGFVYDTHMPGNDDEVFVNFQNFTILDVNPKITQDLFDFAFGQLQEGGFVGESVELSSDTFKNYLNQGVSYADAAGEVLNLIKTEFDSQLDTIASYQSPFNIYFRIYPVYLDENYVTYFESSYSYTGGAHGITVTDMKTYNLKSGELLTINDIVKPEGMEEIHREVAAHMAYSYPIYENIDTVEQYIDSLNVYLSGSSEEESGESKITMDNYPLPNPAITEEGLVFIYQMYTMAPGSDGCPVVMLPYNDIKGCLQPGFSR